MTDNAERQRLAGADVADWRRWGPYLAERQWGTVREDYSANGDSWNYFPFSHAHRRAYRWGEDGLAGWSDVQCRLCLALALWNGQDPILKERLFGLANAEGNHGEDVKELYYYLDATPTHSYLKMLYKYPQSAFPYQSLLDENHRRGRDKPEFEILDTGIFNDDRYFDIVVEYAKACPNDALLNITIHNRGPRAATLHVLPQLWFRNTWSWRPSTKPRPEIVALDDHALLATHRGLGELRLYADDHGELLFCDNNSNSPSLFKVPAKGYFKDAFDGYVVHGNRAAVNPQRRGTKAAVHYEVSVPAAGQQTIRLRLTDQVSATPFADFAEIVQERTNEADAFYAELQHDLADEDARRVQRQALAGMIWNKQCYLYDVPRWLSGDSLQPPPPAERLQGRNHQWTHLNNADVIAMPDKWEYPWYAAWDLGFHCLPLAMVDAEFAKEQLVLLMREWYMHPNGQLPAYEWNFSDVNPPVHGWAAWRVFQIDRKQRGDHGDLKFLERVFHKLMINFTWWVNRKDVLDRNIFQGGFLGLDNIGVFDRSQPLPAGEYLNQADGTAWMAMYSLNLMRIALELALHNSVYEDIASKFFEHFLSIAYAMSNMDEGRCTLWDDEDQFYYDKLFAGDGQVTTLRVRSIVGLIPLFAVETLEPELLARLPDFNRRLEWYLNHRPELAALVSHWQEPGLGERRLLSLLRGHRMKKLLARALDESEFLSPHGVRSLSRAYAQRPYSIWCNGTTMTVDYEPGDSQSAIFGGNSNWRGPIWFPVNYLLIESLQKFHHYYGNDFQVECPTSSGQMLTLHAVAEELTRGLTRLFLRDAAGRRIAFGDCEKLNNDPHFRDHVLFFEFFDGDSGRGLGAAHQTGWTGLVAKLLQPRHAEHRRCDLKANRNAHSTSA